MSIRMWADIQELMARVDALEKRALKNDRAPEMDELLKRLDKFEAILGKHMAPKRG